MDMTWVGKQMPGIRWGYLVKRLGAGSLVVWELEPMSLLLDKDV